MVFPGLHMKFLVRHIPCKNPGSAVGRHLQIQMEEVVAGAAAPWILERDKRTSFLVSGRREREETESRARTEFWRSFRYAGWTRGDWVGDLFLICFFRG